RRAVLNLRTGRLGLVVYVGAINKVLELGDAAFIVALRFLGCMVLGIFRTIAMGACLGNRLDDAWTLFLLAPAQFFLQLNEAVLRHGYLFDHFLVLHE